MSKLALLAAVLIGAVFCAAGCTTSSSRAAMHGDLDALRNLISAGADLDVADGNGETPLMKTALLGKTEAARMLLDAGANPNRGTMFGTPLSYAVNFKRAELAALLLARGATPTTEARALAATASAAAAAPPRSSPGNLDDAAYDRLRASAGMPAEARAPVSDVDSPAKSGVQRPDDFALVIGIEDYQSLPRADYGVRDAQTVRKHLEALGFPARNIISLEGARATGNKLKSYLEEWLPLNVSPTSTLFVYYSGHGAPDPATGDAYLVPWDGDATFLKSTAYPLKKLYADLSKTKAKRVIVALDACFSGAGGRSVLAQGARPLVAKVADVPAGERMTVLAAASGEEITGTLNEQGHGMFTYFLLKGLADGKKTARQLHDYLTPRVQDEARRQNRQQTPSLAGASLDSPLLP